MSIENMLLKFEGLSDEQIAQVHKALEDTEALLHDFRTNILPKLERQVAVFEQVLATINANQRKFNAS